MDGDEGGPLLGARWGERVLSGCRLGGSGCGERVGLGRATGDADLGGVLGSGWEGYVLTWFARGVVNCSQVRRRSLGGRGVPGHLGQGDVVVFRTHFLGPFDDGSLGAAEQQL